MVVKVVSRLLRRERARKEFEREWKGNRRGVERECKGNAKGTGTGRDSRGLIKSGAPNSRLDLSRLTLSRRKLSTSSFGCQLGMLQPRNARS